MLQFPRSRILAKMEFIHTYINTSLSLFLACHLSPFSSLSLFLFLHLSYVYEIAAFCEKRTKMSHSTKISENTHTSVLPHTPLCFCSHSERSEQVCMCAFMCCIFAPHNIIRKKSHIQPEAPQMENAICSRTRNLHHTWHFGCRHDSLGTSN